MTDLLTQHITFFIQLANFLIVLAILNPLLIKPIRKIIQARKEAAAALLGESESFFQSAEGKLAQYEKALSAAREEALVDREKARNEAVAAGDSITAKASQEAQSSLRASREKIGEETASAFAVLEKEIDPLARQIKDKVTA